jgi:hypothetical protein
MQSCYLIAAPRRLKNIQETSNQTKSKYALHILEYNHGNHTIENTVEIIRTAQKGRYLDVLEIFIKQINPY